MKHRILGVLVVLGLIILLLPLLQSNKELPPETALVKAPPFPEQTTTQPLPAQADASPVPLTPPVTDTQPVQTVASNSDLNPTPSPLNNTVSPNDTPPDLVNVVKPTPIQSIEAPAMPAPQPEPKQTIADFSPPPKKIKTTAHKIKLPHKISKPSTHSRAQLTQLMHAPLDNNGLINLKNSAWVIQVGNFKNKAHALKLVNQLRTSGYRAFIQHINTNDVRVFIGPEIKQTAALALANQLEGDLHIRGMVIKYQPLAL